MSSDIVGTVRKQCLDRGLAGIKGLSVLFRHMDKDFNKGLSWDEFSTGMTRYGIHLEEQQLRDLFRLLDKDCSGHVDFREFLHQLQPPMSVNRLAVVNEAFDKMDVVKDGVLDLQDMKSKWLISYIVNWKGSFLQTAFWSKSSWWKRW